MKTVLHSWVYQQYTSDDQERTYLHSCRVSLPWWVPIYIAWWTEAPVWALRDLPMVSGWQWNGQGRGLNLQALDP